MRAGATSRGIVVGGRLAICCCVFGGVIVSGGASNSTDPYISGSSIVLFLAIPQKKKKILHTRARAQNSQKFYLRSDAAIGVAADRVRHFSAEDCNCYQVSKISH